MIANRVVAATAAAAIVVVSPARSDPGPVPPESVRRVVDAGGFRRTYGVLEPVPAAPRGVLVVLHGAGGDAARIRALTGGAFERLAVRERLLLVHPEAYAGRWNDCRTGATHPAREAGVDDVDFVLGLVERLRVERGAPDAPLWIVGYSNGGHLAYRIAVERPEKVAAVATFGASPPAPGSSNCPPPASLPPFLWIAGTDDPISPFGGGPVRAPDGTVPGRVRPVEEAARELGSGSEPGDPVVVPDADGDGTRVRCRTWTAGGRIVLATLIVEGGGHTLPGPASAFPADVVGATAREVDGVEAIWRFFAGRPPVGTPREDRVESGRGEPATRSRKDCRPVPPARPGNRPNRGTSRSARAL